MQVDCSAHHVVVLRVSGEGAEVVGHGEAKAKELETAVIAVARLSEFHYRALPSATRRNLLASAYTDVHVYT